MGMNSLSEDQIRGTTYDTNFDEFKEQPSEGYVRRNRPGTTKNVSWVLCLCFETEFDFDFDLN